MSVNLPVKIYRWLMAAIEIAIISNEGAYNVLDFYHQLDIQQHAS